MMESIEYLLSSIEERDKQRVLSTYLERLYNEQKKRERQADRELSEKIHHLQSQYHELPATAQLFISEYYSKL